MGRVELAICGCFELEKEANVLITHIEAVAVVRRCRMASHYNLHRHPIGFIASDDAASTTEKKGKTKEFRCVASSLTKPG
jgi:hypothetical protein